MPTPQPTWGHLLSAVDDDRLSLFTPKTPLGLVFLTVPLYRLAGLGIGAKRPGSLARYGVLPPATLIAYAVACHSFDVMPRLLMINIVAGIVCAAWTAQKILPTSTPLFDTIHTILTHAGSGGNVGERLAKYTRT